MSASTVSAAAKRLMSACAVVLALAALSAEDACAQTVAPFAMPERTALDSLAGGNFVVTRGDVAAVAAFVRSQGERMATGAAEPSLVRVPRPSEVMLPIANHFVVTDVDVVEVAAYVSRTTALARAEMPVDPRRFASAVLPKRARLKAGFSGEFAELQVSRAARGGRVARF
jgi:microcompartment protein CcmL/EutN